MNIKLKNRLDGKIAVVTASTSGIGFAIAKRLAEEGAHVIISSRKQENVDAATSKLISEGLKVTGVVCDVLKLEDTKSLLNQADKLGGVDILVLAAGRLPKAGNILTCKEKAWDTTFDLNVKSSFLLVKEAIPLIKKRGGGKIVFLASIEGIQPDKGFGVYSVTKTAVISLAKVLALELAVDNITVNCVAPGLIKTKSTDQIIKNDALRGEAFSKIAMCRLGVPEEISGIVAFLASDDASFVTGETICATGGAPSRL